MQRKNVEDLSYFVYHITMTKESSQQSSIGSWNMVLYSSIYQHKALKMVCSLDNMLMFTEKLTLTLSQLECVTATSDMTSCVLQLSRVGYVRSNVFIMQELKI